MEDKKRIRLYKEYEIVACSYQLSDSGKWTLNIEIQNHYGGGVTVTNYSASNTFDTEEEAIKHCFQFGKKIIDGDITWEKKNES